METLLLTFANDKSQPLQTLTDEYLAASKILAPRAFRQHYLMHPLYSATLDDVTYYLMLFRERLSLFLYSGHADRDRLCTEGGDTNADGIAHLLGQCPNLKVVILNGCSTKDQVELLHKAGIPLVIATESPVGDSAATAFSQKLFLALEAGSNIKEAYEQGIGFVKADNDITQKRGMMGLADFDTSENWNIHPNPTITAFNPENWKLPTQPARPPQTNYVENSHLLETLFETFAKTNDAVARLYDDGADLEEDLGQITHTLLKALPAPVSEHVRKLILPPTANTDSTKIWSVAGKMRLEQLVLTYQICMDFMAYVLLAQVWENALRSDLDFSKDKKWQTDLRAFLGSDTEQRQYADYYSVLRMLREALEGVEKTPFIEELTELRSEFMENEDVKNACFFLETLRRQTEQLEQIPQAEIVSLCARAEESLATIFSKIGFLGNYMLATVRNIDVMKYRHTEVAEFNHMVVKWHGTLGIYDKEYRKQLDFMDNRSVVLLRLKNGNGKQSNEKKGGDFLNLSPFILDENTFERVPDTSLSKLYFFAGRDTESGQLFYKYVNEPREDIINLDDKEFYDRKKKATKFQLAKEQFEAFFETVLNPDTA